MRDDNDYAKMSLAELRESLQSTSQQLATWHYALASAKKDHARSFIEGYSLARGKSVAERVKEAEMASVADLGVCEEYQGNVDFYTTIRDLQVVLIENYV